jgi:hypothetical protein
VKPKGKGCKKDYYSYNSQGDKPDLIVIYLVEFNIFSITPDHDQNKRNGKKGCKNKLSSAKHFIYI